METQYHDFRYAVRLLPIFAAIAMSLFVVVVLASYIPARRAMRVDPLIALRYE
jgi:ABC-type lipoprotein release transport system permease subunit